MFEWPPVLVEPGLGTLRGLQNLQPPCSDSSCVSSCLPSFSRVAVLYVERQQARETGDVADCGEQTGFSRFLFVLAAKVVNSFLSLIKIRKGQVLGQIFLRNQCE